jgi:hypothetical protein
VEIKSSIADTAAEKNKVLFKSGDINMNGEYSNTTGLPYMYKNKQKYSQQYDSTNRIPDNAKY